MIKINKFLAASVVTLSLAACDLAPYSSIAVYADQAAKVVCDERYWVAARSGPGTEYELEHKLSNGKDIIILEQATGADGKVWYKAKYNLAANNEECVSYIRSDLYQQVPAQLHQTMRRQGMLRQTPAMRMPYSRIMRRSLPLQPHREHMLQVRLQVAMCMSAMQQAHPALQRLSHSTGTIRLT